MEENKKALYVTRGRNYGKYTQLVDNLKVSLKDFKELKIIDVDYEDDIKKLNTQLNTAQKTIDRCLSTIAELEIMLYKQLLEVK
jgi:lipid II:glycine glycyltransferase (peptidoglycan interpeptide bridge formation enzyme)